MYKLSAYLAANILSAGRLITLGSRRNTLTDMVLGELNQVYRARFSLGQEIS